ncbi:MAG TPA: glycosyltransferase family 4 protein [Catenuloplanes sp.]|jgi:glycosyltransferase involved in cell wall biosynthesis
MTTPQPPGGRTDASGWHGDVALVLGSSTGGVGQHVAQLTRDLMAGGTRVVVCGPVATDDLFGFSATGATFEPVEIPANPGLQDAGAIRALRRAWTASPPDVVHAHGLRAGLVATLARPAAPLVVTWHNAVLGHGLRRQAAQLVERIVARGARVTLAASADLVQRAREAGALDARLAPVAAPTAAPPRRTRAAVRAEFAVSPRTPLILSVGRLHPQKRYELLIDAAARWRVLRPPPVVVIAGSGPSYMFLAGRVSAAQAPVTLLGHRTDVPDLLAGADLAVVTSEWEARQLFAQEALRAGVPLVATAVGGIPDLVGDAARLVPPADVEALDTAVRDLLADADLRADYARRGLARAATWPTDADTLSAVRAVYQEVSSAGSHAGTGPR